MSLLCFASQHDTTCFEVVLSLVSCSAPANHVFSVDFLQVNKSLTSLNMADNKQITDKGWAEFAKGLAVLTLFWRHLLLCSSFLGPFYYLPTIFTTQDIGNISKNCSSST